MMLNKKPISEWKQYINPSGKCLYWNQKPIFLCNTYIKKLFWITYSSLLYLKSSARMIWFLYMEFTLLALGAVLQIAAIVLSYRNRNKRRTNIKHILYLVYVWLSWMTHWPLLLCQSHIQKLPHWKSTYFGFMCIFLSD